jgi:Tfp pilus assembly protein PilX
MRRTAQGFALIITIFVILVLAALGAFAMRIGLTQQQTASFSLLNARAQAAADSGIEFGANQSLLANNCPPTYPVLNIGAAGLAGFTVTVTCSLSGGHTVAGTAYQSVVLTSTAQHGLYGSADFVQRSVTRSINNAPP